MSLVDTAALSGAHAFLQAYLIVTRYLFSRKCTFLFEKQSVKYIGPQRVDYNALNKYKYGKYLSVFFRSLCQPNFFPLLLVFDATPG